MQKTKENNSRRDDPCPGNRSLTTIQPVSLTVYIFDTSFLENPIKEHTSSRDTQISYKVASMETTVRYDREYTFQMASTVSMTLKVGLVGFAVHSTLPLSLFPRGGACEEYGNGGETIDR